MDLASLGLAPAERRAFRAERQLAFLNQTPDKRTVITGCIAAPLLMCFRPGSRGGTHHRHRSDGPDLLVTENVMTARPGASCALMPQGTRIMPVRQRRRLRSAPCAARLEPADLPQWRSIVLERQLEVQTLRAMPGSKMALQVPGQTQNTKARSAVDAAQRRCPIRIIEQ